MTASIGIVWNPAKIDEEALREAVEDALDEVYGADDDHATEPEDGYDEAEPGDADGDDDLDDAERPRVRWFETSVDDPGYDAAGDALEYGCELVVAAGGDGTVRAVASRLGHSGQAAADLGIVPLGTGNLLARNLGIPLRDVVDALVRAFSGEPRPIDLGEATLTDTAGGEQTQGFVVMAGFGIDALMIAETDDDLKARAGWLAYVDALGRAVNGLDPVALTLAHDGGAPVDEHAHTVIVGNCGSLQGGITLLPDARPDDGELDVLVLRGGSIVAWLDTLRTLSWDNGLLRRIRQQVASLGSARARAELDQGSVDSLSAGFLRVRALRGELPRPLRFEIDGDDVGEVVSFAVRVLPGALNVRA